MATICYLEAMISKSRIMPITSRFAGFDAEALLDWYDHNARQLPWRAFSPVLAPAYHVFLSELMLQQTVVATVIPYFQTFIHRWPHIEALAAADEEDVLKAWAGLGYYARARNMLKAARLICTNYGGRFPQSVEELVKLPGIGPYTAGAIAAIAFAQPSVVLDGNIERVLIRFANMEQPKTKIKAELTQGYLHVLPHTRRSDFPQAMMDLGASICAPKRARCHVCPLATGCAARYRPNPADLPVKPAKGVKPVRKGRLMIIINEEDGQVVMVKRPSKGLLGGMMGFPSSGWDKTQMDQKLLASLSGLYLVRLPHHLRHSFTHFTADLEVSLVWVSRGWRMPKGYIWAPISPDDWPSLFKKAWQLGDDVNSDERVQALR